MLLFRLKLKLSYIWPVELFQPGSFVLLSCFHCFLSTSSIFGVNVWYSLFFLPEHLVFFRGMWCFEVSIWRKKFLWEEFQISHSCVRSVECGRIEGHWSRGCCSIWMKDSNGLVQGGGNGEMELKDSIFCI